MFVLIAHFYIIFLVSIFLVDKREKKLFNDYHFANIQRVKKFCKLKKEMESQVRVSRIKKVILQEIKFFFVLI